MKKRLICLALTLVMVMACFAGCAEKSDEKAAADREEAASASATTLSMYLLADNLPEDAAEREAQIAKIEKEVNKLTEGKFKTRLDLRIYASEAEYYAALDKAYADTAANGGVQKPTEEEQTKEDEYEVDDLGVTRIKYPQIADYQVDIMYLGGYDVFTKYVNANRIQQLDGDLDTTAKQLKEYISPTLLKYSKSLTSATYAIPANVAIGEYTYLIFDAKVMEYLNYNSTNGLSAIGNNISAASFAQYLNDVKNNISKFTTDAYVPFATNLTVTELAQLCIQKNDWGDLDVTNDTMDKLHYFGVDANGQYTPDEFSLFTSSYQKDATNGNKNSWMNNAGTDTAILEERVDAIMGYKRDGLLAKETEGVKAAVRCVRGSKFEMDAYKAAGYEVVAIKNPELDSAKLYEDMFAVSSTSNTARSMEIINYLYTNEEFRNLLMYGIENEDYELVPSETQTNADGTALRVVKDLNPSYGFSAKKLGNTLIGHYTENDTPAYRKSVMLQNDVAAAGILMGYKYDAVIKADNITLLATNSAAAAKLINECDPADYFAAGETSWWDAEIAPLAAQLAELDREPAANEQVTAGKFFGIKYSYTEWAVGQGIYSRPTDPDAQ